MTIKKTTDTKPKKAENKPNVNSKVEKFAIRQVFYSNKCYDENLIKIMERIYKHQKKTEEEWVEILTKKKITF